MSQRAHSGGARLRDALDIFDWFDGLFEHPASALVMLLVVACTWLAVLKTRGTEVVR